MAQKNGLLDINILTKTDSSYETYYVCDKEGNIIGQSSELDPVQENVEMSSEKKI